MNRPGELRGQTLRRAGKWWIGPAGLPIPHLGANLSDRALAVIMVLPAFGLMLAYVLYPLWTVVSMSFDTYANIAAKGTWVGGENYSDLLHGSEFWPALGRTIYYTLTNVVAQTIIGFVMALLLNMTLKGRNLARGIILFPFIVASVVAALIWLYIFDPITGIINYVLISTHVVGQPLGLLADPHTAMNGVVLISVWKSVPFSTLVFLASLQTLPNDQVEAAKCDGANALQVFRYIVLPWVSPILLVVVVFRTIASFNEYDMPYLLTQGGPLNSTLVLSVFMRQLFFDRQSPGVAAALAVVMGLLLVSVAAVALLVGFRRSQARLRS